jgi:hypothetical protein
MARMRGNREKRGHLAVAWLVVGIVSLLLVGCEGISIGRYSEVEEKSFDLGSTPGLNLESFGGNVTVRAGAGSTVAVVATKRAKREQDLKAVTLRMAQVGGEVRVKAEKPAYLNDISVDFEITTPRGTVANVVTGGGNLKISGTGGAVNAVTGGGNVEVSETAGAVSAVTGGGDVKVTGAKGATNVTTGGGNIEIRDASDSVEATTGGGNIEYRGRPQGGCNFSTGGGNIKLRLDADSNATLNLEVPKECERCRVDVDFSVDGQVTRRKVSGTIGTGDEGAVRAATGGGNIDVVRR